MSVAKTEIVVTTRPLERVRADMHAVFVAKGDGPTGLSADAAKAVEREMEARSFDGDRGASLVVSVPNGRARGLVIVVGLGDGEELTSEVLHGASARVAREAKSARAETVAMAIPTIEDMAPADVVRLCGEAFRLGQYRFDRYRRRKDKGFAVKRLIACTPAGGSGLRAAAREAAIVADAVGLARDLVNTPPADMNPKTMEEAALSATRGTGIRVKVLRVPQLRREKMGALMAVGQGSKVPPCLIHATYRPKQSEPKETLAWVGKGITFDSGGYNLKGTGNIETMKCDMAGSAAVLVALIAAARLEVPVEIHAVMPMAENLVSGDAFKPGDVLATRAGVSVEINNTDAEGRLVLADALDYARQRIKPDAMVDLATLTGACVVALGPSVTGLMTDHEDLSERLLEAAERAGEKMWRLPLVPEYDKQLESTVADCKNTGTRWGGALTAGLFLKRFVGKTRWAHLDIAGPAWSDSDDPFLGKDGTGAGVATLIEMARRR